MASRDQVLLWPTTGSDCQISVVPKTTQDTSPELRGQAPRDASTVDVVVDGNTYQVPVVNGTWMLPQGTIAPPLADGVYDVSVSGLCGGELVFDSTVDELEIETQFWIWQNGDDHIWQDNELADFQ